MKPLASGSSPELASEFERGRRRIRRANLTGLASIVFRGAMLLSSLLYVPATIHYLGPQRYGLWVAMTSLVALIAFADCGFGFSLMNDVAYSLGRGRHEAVRRAISSTFFVLAAIGVAGCLLFAASYSYIPWQFLFSTRTPQETTEASRTVAVIVSGFLLTIPFTTVQRVQSAHQEGFKTQLWEIGGVVLSLAGLLIAIRLRAGLTVLAVVFTSGPLLAMFANWMYYFVFRHRTELPVLHLFDYGLARRIARDGAYFTVLQIAGIAVFSSDTFIVLHYFGQTTFAQYSLIAKVFQITPALAGVWFGALWPAYSEAIANGDQKWVQRTLLQSTLISSGGCAILSALLAIMARPLIRIWTGVEVSAPPKLLVGWVVYWVIVLATSSISTYLSGSNVIKGQMILAVAHASISIGLRVVFCKYGDISGAVWGTNVAYLLVVVPTYFVLVPAVRRRQLAFARSQDRL